MPSCTLGEPVIRFNGDGEAITPRVEVAELGREDPLRAASCEVAPTVEACGARRFGEPHQTSFRGCVSNVNVDSVAALEKESKTCGRLSRQGGHDGRAGSGQ